MGVIVAHTVVEFGEGADSSTSYVWLAEPDDESNNDKTSFIIGDSVVLRVNHSSNVEILRVVATDGSVRQTSNSVSRSKTEEVLFADNTPSEGDRETWQVPVIPSSVSFEYMGRQGVVKKRIPYANMVEYLPNISKVPFRAKITYNYNCKLFTLSSPVVTLNPDETYTIDVVFYLKVTEAK